jgi:hypothetical protein
MILTISAVVCLSLLIGLPYIIDIIMIVFLNCSMSVAIIINAVHRFIYACPYRSPLYHVRTLGTADIIFTVHVTVRLGCKALRPIGYVLVHCSTVHTYKSRIHRNENKIQ